MNATYFIRKTLINYLNELANLKKDSQLTKNKKFKDIHKGKRCFILGSGHSIMKNDLTKLNKEIVMTQNHFNVHKDIMEINPDYHVVVPKFHPSEYNSDWIDWIKNMETTLPEHTQFFFGKNTFDLIENKTNLGQRSNYVETGFHAVCLNEAKADITKRIMNVPTVITQCLIIALYMGFDEIFLVGFDLDQICRLSDRENLRFYGHSHITANDAENAIMDDYKEKGNNFFNFWLVWQQLILINKHALTKNQKIINATSGGILDIFPRTNYDKLF